MAGLTEILVLILLILGVLILPRLLKPASSRQKLFSKQTFQLTLLVRAGIILSLVYPAAIALYFRPWEGALVPFLGFGVLPVFLAWSIVWVMNGNKNT